jgi:hypothetical protein
MRFISQLFGMKRRWQHRCGLIYRTIRCELIAKCWQLNEEKGKPAIKDTQTLGREKWRHLLLQTGDSDKASRPQGGGRPMKFKFRRAGGGFLSPFQKRAPNEVAPFAFTSDE